VAEEFQANPEVETVLEGHARQLSKLNQEEMKRVLELYKRARQDVRDRLDAYSGGTFTAQKLGGVLAQIEAGIAQMNQQLTEGMSSAGMTLSELGIEQLVQEIKRFERIFSGAVVPINVNVVQVASDTSNFLFNKYEASISAYSEQMRSLFAQNLSLAAVEEIPMGEVVARVGKFFLGEEWRLTRIVRTELMGVYSYGKLAGMREVQQKDLPDLMKTLYIPLDARTGDDSKVLSKNIPVVPVDEPFVEYSLGHKATYMAPPNRPNDRSILIPYRESWSG